MRVPYTFIGIPGFGFQLTLLEIGFGGLSLDLLKLSPSSFDELVRDISALTFS